MQDIIIKFTLECRTNKSGKVKRFKPNRAKKVIKEVEEEISISKDIKYDI